MPVEGLNQLETRIKHSVTAQIKFKQTDFAAKLEFLVIPRICNALPLDPVIKLKSSTTKVRIVFDGSAKSSTGISLNDALKVGPTLQQTLLDILIRSGTHQILLSADIEKMYRMINIDKLDMKF